MKHTDLWSEWGLMMTKDGGPHTNLTNAIAILQNDPISKGGIYYDEFMQRIMRVNSPPRPWRDSDDLELTTHIQSNLQLAKMSVDTVSKAVITIADRNRRNCVVEWMNALEWDGTQRLEKFFSDYFGAIDNEYTRAAGKNFWLSLAARAYKRGCKVDNMIVLEGAQGVGKSSALQIIGGEWFAEQHETALNPKAFAEVLQGKLLVEISEMDAFSRVEVSRVKQTISCVSDRFRAAYARHAEDHPRTCVFVGTTNRDDWNRDETGARRFWPIACRGSIDLQAIRENRLQFFAEAAHRFKMSESHWEMPLESAREEQEARYSPDTWLEPIAQAVKGEQSVTTSWVLGKLGVTTERMDRRSEMRVGACLRFLGWARKQRRIDGIPTWQYEKVETVVTGGDKIPF